MSDWGAVPEWDFALKGLDQESGIQIDVKQWGDEPFTDRLRSAYAEGKLPKERLSDMVRRILRSLYAVGVDKRGRRRKSTWPSTTRSHSRPRVRASCC